MYRFAVVFASLLITGLVACGGDPPEQTPLDKFQAERAEKKLESAAEAAKAENSAEVKELLSEPPAAPKAVAPAPERSRPALSKTPAKQSREPRIQTPSPNPEAEEPYNPLPIPAQRPQENEQVVVPGAPRPSSGGRTSYPQSYPDQDRTRDSASTVPPRRELTLVVPEGTALEVRLTESLRSDRQQTGDEFDAILDRDIVIDGEVVARRGSRITGELVEVLDGGRVRGRAEMTLALRQIRIGEESYDLVTNSISIQAESSQKDDAKTIGAGAGIGAVIGAIAGGKKGAAIGAAVGGGAGTARVLTTKGKDAELDREQLLSFRLERDLPVRVR